MYNTNVGLCLQYLSLLLSIVLIVALFCSFYLGMFVHGIYQGLIRVVAGLILVFVHRIDLDVPRTFLGLSSLNLDWS